MLFYTQIKREFTPMSWKRGQVYFREERVANVKLEGDKVIGQVQGTVDKPYDIEIQVKRGTILSSHCSCPAHKEQYEKHCKHVAALSIWVVERGSLLRTASVSGNTLGMGSQVRIDDNALKLINPEKALIDPRLNRLMRSNPMLAGSRYLIRKDHVGGSLEGRDAGGYSFSLPITATEAFALVEHSMPANQNQPRSNVISGEPVLYVRGSFQGKVLSAVTVESAIQYIDPNTGLTQIHTLTYLIKQKDPGIWKTTQGIYLYVPPVETFAASNDPENTDLPEINFIQRLDTSKIIHQGQQGLEELAKLLQHPLRAYMVFDANVNVPVEKIPLKLQALQLGEKLERSRKVGFIFKGENFTLDSNELEELNKLGRLSNFYVWKGDRIYRFEQGLTRLHQYANRTGVASVDGIEEEEKDAVKVSGWSSVRDDGDHPLHPIAVLRMSLEMGVDQMDVDPEWTEFHDWKKLFDKRKLPLLPKVKYGFKLRAYQRNGLSWLWSLYHRGLAALLADDMGLGKTHQVLAFLTSVYRGKAKVRTPTLVVAPTSVIAAWIQKLKKYPTGLKYCVFHGSRRSLPKSGVDIVLTTYGILHREELLRQKEWHCVILDEAQAIKNASTISSRAARAVRGKFKIAMTGTPVENQSADLWSLMEFLLPGYLGTLARFKRLYGWGKVVPTETEAEALKRLISPFLLRRTKSQVLKELPEKTEEVIQLELTPIQRKAYREILAGEDAEKARKELTDKATKIDYANILALLTRLKQVCDHPKLAKITQGKIKNLEKVDPLDSAKWEVFEELLQEALGSELKVVVFTQYLGMIDLMSHYLKKAGVGHTELRGDTPDRAARMERFAEDPECKVFLCSLLAGGLGIDLTAGSVCIHYDRWWNPAKENQATDRLHRFGQTRGVQVFKLQISNTVEDRIASIIQNKMALSGALIEESSVGLKSFSRKDLLDLLTLKEE